MKTLDEVIKAWSICFSDNSRSDCTGCPYADEDGDAACFNHDREDALHYLKEYRSKQDTIAEQLAELEQKNDHVCELAKTVCEEYDRLCNRLAEEYSNDPLTWDELKSMEGKPVWFELLNHDIWDDPSYIVDSEWWIIGEVRKDDIILATYLDKMELFKDDLGKTWQLYRKERR